MSRLCFWFSVFKREMDVQYLGCTIYSRVTRFNVVFLFGDVCVIGSELVQPSSYKSEVGGGQPCGPNNGR